MIASPQDLAQRHAVRTATYGTVATELALLDDSQLGVLLDEAVAVGSGIGGTTLRLDIAGTPVFVKRVPLTDLERQPDNVRSTANHFQLPPHYQYGIGSAGFGVWRELAAHTMTTNWVLTGDCPNFPLMYHWRVLTDRTPAQPSGETKDELDRMADYWGSPAVRTRLEAIERATAGVVLFLEHVPQTASQWLSDRLAESPQAAAEAATLVDVALSEVVTFINARGLLHFDAHFGNLLTDGEQLYLSDFGLATTRRFDLSPAETEFFEAHTSYDRYCTRTQVVVWLLAALYPNVDRAEIVRRCGEGDYPAGLPDAAVRLLESHAADAAVMYPFYRRLQTESRSAPYPMAGGGSTRDQLV